MKLIKFVALAGAILMGGLGLLILLAMLAADEIPYVVKASMLFTAIATYLLVMISIAAGKRQHSRILSYTAIYAVIAFIFVVAGVIDSHALINHLGATTIVAGIALYSQYSQTKTNNTSQNNEC